MMTMIRRRKRRRIH